MRYCRKGTRVAEGKDFNFKFWDGDIFGKNLEVVKNKKLVQDWSENGWENPSRVTFSLISNGGKTELTLIHENVPGKELKSIDDGWDEYYLSPLKNLLENS